MAAGCIPRGDLGQGRWLCKILRFAQDDIGKGWKDNGGAEREVRQREDEAGVDPWQRVVFREATSVKGDGCVRSFASLRMTSGRDGRTMEGWKDNGGAEREVRQREDEASVDPWQRVVFREATSVKGDGCVRSFASLRMTSGRDGRTMEGTEGEWRGGELKDFCYVCGTT